MAALELRQLNLVVRDMAASVAFYERLGLTFAPTRPEWEAHHRRAELPGGMVFELDSETFTPMWNRGFPGRGSGSVAVTFHVPARDEVDRIYAAMVGAGYPAQQPPYDAFWGARYALLADPDGNSVGLMSPVEEARLREPPAPPPP